MRKSTAQDQVQSDTSCHPIHSLYSHGKTSPIFASSPDSSQIYLTSLRIGEKFIEWTDTTPHIDHILTNISLYWFTGGFPRSIYPYRQLFGTSRSHFEYIKKPTGVSFFPLELFPIFKPMLENNCDLVMYKEHKSGGHFAALEQPKELWQDVEEFVGLAWKV